MPSVKAASSIVFPDVCKTPAPPAPFVPVPYPNVQYEANLKAANMADARAAVGDSLAGRQKQDAIDSLYQQTGIRAKSATQAVMIGFTVNGSLSPSGTPNQTR
jgi:Toxin PAAR-like domain